jgi:hypothetical protein
MMHITPQNLQTAALSGPIECTPAQDRELIVAAIAKTLRQSPQFDRAPVRLTLLSADPPFIKLIFAFQQIAFGELCRDKKFASF